MRPLAALRLACLAFTALALAAPPATAGAAGTPQSKAQQKCITSYGAAAANVAKARAAENQKCLSAFAKGKLDAPTLRSCLARDAKGKVGKQVAKVDKVLAKSCAGDGAADFGVPPGGSAPAANVGAGEATKLFLDVLSENLFATARTCDDDSAGCKCQAAIEDGAADVAAAALTEFAGCAKKTLKAGAGTAGALALCATDPTLEGSIAADSKGRLAKAREKVGRTHAKKCEGAALAVLPGKCAGRPEDGTCFAEAATCRACLALNAIHGLAAGCDLLDDGADNASCPAGAVDQATFLIPSTAEPAETPGTAGVVVANPKLLAHVGANADLNHGVYTRYKFRSPPSAVVDAILVLVPGFEGGAGGFQLLAENLIPRAYVETGLVFEIWGFDRRTHQLEDLEGLDAAEAVRDPQLALNWLFGEELALDLAPLPRRAEFYGAQDVPFIANWTPLVHTFDIDAVIEEARTVARNGNVFLGGHSAGTGFTARYAATNLALDPMATPEPGYEKLLGLVLLEGGGGSTSGSVPSETVLDAIEARADGALFDAVASQEGRCTDLLTPCTEPTAAVDCAAFTAPTCAPVPAYAQFLGLLSPQLLASAESIALQATVDPEGGQAILQVDQGGTPGNNAVDQVPELAGLAFLLSGDATAQGAIGAFIDDDGLVAGLASFVAMSVGASGPDVNGLSTWLDIEESSAWPSCTPPNDADCVTPDNGVQPTETPAAPWGLEAEPIRYERLLYTFFQGGTNFTDWYYPSSGLSTTSGLQGLDSSPLSLPAPAGRGRSDIENLTEAANIDIPVIGLGGTNGLTTVPGAFVPFGNSIGACTAPSCDGTPRVVDDALPSEAFPTLGGVAGGFEAYVSIGYSHVDPLAAEDGSDNLVIGPLIDFLERNTPPAP